MMSAASQSPSGRRRRWVRPLVISSVAAASLIAYAVRGRIAAELWHWRFGNVVWVGTYEVPVPKHWGVRRDVPGEVEIIDMRLHFSGRSLLSRVNVVTAYVRPYPISNLPSWAAFQREFLYAQGKQPLDERVITINGETIRCMGGNLAQGTGLPDMGATAMVCESDGGLSLNFVGQPHDLQTFYSIASGVQRARH